ncbi:hypothetical protein EXIGLDRAFT_698393 [Exidia glandulosa HHB12029]|uniref:C2H2-type domain-containing protein n=1 Tax=Exidia glandulosa HHB12029 TaxID=1314781 RepID=A0A165EB75_EXIGL|nr:hypothetical protein EXIGLDRAFT_698393 [Exidia glandulosa HHB12029]
MPRVSSNAGSCICTHCGMRFVRKSELNRHIQGSHERSLRYGCTECLHTTAQKSNMSRHMLSKHGVTGAPLVIDMRSMASTSQLQSPHNVSASRSNFDWDFRQLGIPLPAVNLDSDVLSGSPILNNAALSTPSPSSSYLSSPSTSYTYLPPPSASYISTDTFSPLSSPQNTAAFNYSPPTFPSGLSLSQADFDALMWYSALSVVSRSSTASHTPHSSESPSRYPHRSS